MVGLLDSLQEDDLIKGYMSNTMMTIIDNKKVNMTVDETEVYKKICKSYDRPNFKGQLLFSNLFEVDDNGIIIFIRPPTQATSLEVIIFLQSIMIQQHIRLMQINIDKRFAELENKILNHIKKE